jgi:hypothetical protein
VWSCVLYSSDLWRDRVVEFWRHVNEPLGLQNMRSISWLVQRKLFWQKDTFNCYTELLSSLIYFYFSSNFLYKVSSSIFSIRLLCYIFFLFSFFFCLSSVLKHYAIPSQIIPFTLQICCCDCDKLLMREE